MPTDQFEVSLGLNISATIDPINPVCSRFFFISFMSFFFMSHFLKLSEEVNPSKSAGIDNLAGKFLKEDAPALASPVTDLCNLSISLSSFPNDCKIAKLKPLYKKESKKL